MTPLESWPEIADEARPVREERSPKKRLSLLSRLKPVKAAPRRAPRASKSSGSGAWCVSVRSWTSRSSWGQRASAGRSCPSTSSPRGSGARALGLDALRPLALTSRLFSRERLHHSEPPDGRRRRGVWGHEGRSALVTSFTEPRKEANLIQAHHFYSWRATIVTPEPPTFAHKYMSRSCRTGLFSFSWMSTR